MPFLEPALQFCSHLVYSSAGINPDTNKLVPLNEQLDINQDNYRHVTDLKRRFPGLRVLLSVGGGNDVSGEGSEKNMIYRTVVRTLRIIQINLYSKVILSRTSNSLLPCKFLVEMALLTFLSTCKCDLYDACLFQCYTYYFSVNIGCILR